VPKGPSLDPSEKRLAMQTEDHPYEYASFEGVIPPGQYGAGEMIVWDCGVYSPDEGGTVFDDRAEAERRVAHELAAGKLSFELRGEKVKGSFALVRTKQQGQWLLIKHKDRFVQKADVTALDRSVLCGASVAEMKAVPARRIDAARLIPAGRLAAMPAKLEPMHAESAEAPFNRDGWMWEPKLDGYRVLAFVDAGRVSLRSRRGLELAGDYPALAAELATQGAPMILDGELVAFGPDGRPSFNALQNAGAGTPAALVCFDLLHFAGVDVRAAPYADRRRWLAQCLMPSPLVQLVHASGDGVALHEAALASGFEGVIGKRVDSVYESGKRSSAWLKVKPATTAEFVIGGYTRGKGSRASLGSLIVGYWDKGKLRYASHVGSGLDERTLAKLKRDLDALACPDCPFAEEPERNGPPVWVKPQAVAEVSFHSWTEDGRLRAPVFVRLREDIGPKTVKRQAARPRVVEAPGSGDDVIAAIVAQLEAKKSSMPLAVGAHTIPVSNLDRVYWPANPGLKERALTKRDLLRYLAQVSPFMLPHLADRPLTMIRMPQGIGGQRFFQKHWEQERPEFVEGITVFSGHRDESHEYLLCNNLPTLLWLAQSGTLEFHVWHSRARPAPDAASQSTDYATSLESLEASVLNYPDWVVFDIDPYIYSGKEAPGGEPELNTVAFEKGKEVAFRLREVLHGLGLEPIVKTSGKTGLHVFVPIRRALDFDAARHVSELVGRHLVAENPKDVTVEWSIPKRTGKIFMDYNMNVRGKTLNVAYSPRGEQGGPVSMPLTWEELARAHPLDFRLTNAAQRVRERGDRWADACDAKQDLQAALRRASR
ncbi:MAG TPA: non-homologous end-joining DNA ligase, partial [Casimicrobiaceae bacterium]|nr:non-homologous end-joining DNA ligase [Casimicrobiaceae bacterium]